MSTEANDQPTRRFTNWMEQIDDGEFIIDENNNKTIPLRVLNRLADKAGLVYLDTSVEHIITAKSTSLFFAKAIVHFNDGTKWSGIGDCFFGNTPKEFLKYPTATAESRAIARALRRALGLHGVLATEEIEIEDGVGQEPIRPDSKIDPQVVRVLSSEINKLNINIMDIINAIVDNESRRDEISALEEFSAEEGRAALKYIDNIKKMSKKRPQIHIKQELEKRISDLQKDLDR